ncbi:MAG: TolC family protein [Verrucomicrobiales bacterium]
MAQCQTTETLGNAIHQAMENRAELAALKSQIAAGEKSVEAEKPGTSPSLKSGGYGAQSLSFTDDITDGLAGFVGGVRLSIPLRWWTDPGRVLQARSRLRQTEISTEQAKLNIAGQVREAWFDWEEGTSILETSQLVVKQAEEALRLARASFEAGAATQLDVLQSQLELTRARLEEVVALHTYHTALARLRRAMGAGS